ncbi:hypothetical protein D3C76_1606000 [compost metagenome]
MEQLFSPLELHPFPFEHGDDLLDYSHRLLVHQLHGNYGCSARCQAVQQTCDQLGHQLRAPAHITDEQIKFTLAEFDFAGILAQNLQVRLIAE